MHAVFEQIFEGHPDAWSIVDLDGDRIIIVRCNQVQAQRFGMSQAELERTDLRMLVTSAHYAGWLSMLREVEQAGSARSFDFDGPPLVGGMVRATIIPLGKTPSGLARFGAHICDETARKTAESALARSEARLAQAQAIGKIGDWELDLTTGKGTWSREMYRIMDWPNHEPPSFEQFEALVHRDDRDTVRAFHQSLLAASEPVHSVFRLVTPAGETRRIAVTAVCVRDEQGKAVRFAGINRDVTAREDALESAQRHDDALEVLFEENVNGVYFSLLDEPIEWERSLDKDALAEWALDHARPVRVNQSFADVIGAPAHALIGKPMSLFLPERKDAVQQLKRLYDAGRLHLPRVERLRSDGTPWLADIAMVVTHDDNGRITGHFGMVRDITEQDRAAQAQRQAEARWALALESAELYVWSTDLRGQLSEVDPRWAARLGYTAEEMASSDFGSKLVHPADLAASELAFSDHFAGKTPSVTAKYRVATRSGNWRWVEVHGRVTERDDAGAPLRMTGIVRDVTEQRALEQRLLIAERMASLGTLAAGIGHEINNPLTYLSANLALMDDALRAQSDGKPDGARSKEELSRMLADARDGVARIVRIVRDLRALSRGEGASRQPLILRQVIERSLELAEHEIRHRARVERDYAELPAIVADEGRLIQLFLNLLVNAAQAITEGAADANFIRVTTRLGTNADVLVEVSDSGNGMDHDVLSRIFDPFFTTKKVGEGTGLGLAICHSIVNELGGSIEVESALGRGSTFRLRLPLGDGAVHTAPAAAPPESPTSAGLKILVVDDEATVGRLLTRILRGHEVVVETRAAAALARLRAGQSFDRILCDVMMPEMSGMDFYEALEASQPSLLDRIIFMTGGAFSARASAFLARVPNLTVDKPFDPASLRKVVTRPLDAR